MRLVRSGLRLFVGLSFLALPTATSLIRPAAAAATARPEAAIRARKASPLDHLAGPGESRPRLAVSRRIGFPQTEVRRADRHGACARVGPRLLASKVRQTPLVSKQPDGRKKRISLRLKKHLLGLTLHPGFEKNGYLFI